MNSEEKSTIELQVTVVVDKKDETTQNTQTTPEKKDKDNKREKALDKAAINYRFSKKSAFGMILVAFAAVFGSIMSAVVNVLGSAKYKVPAPTITFTRSLFSLIICVIVCFCIKVNPLGPYKEGKKFTWVVLRGLFGGIQITCYFFAFTQIPVGDATTLTFIAPVLTGILAIWMLNEAWGWVDAVASVLCFVGVLFTSKPVWLFPDSQTRLDPFYVFIAFCGSVAASLAYISVRKVGPSVSIFVLINYIFIFTMAINIFQSTFSSPKFLHYISYVISLLGYYKLKTFPWPKKTVSGTAWWLIISTVFLGGGAQVCINRGLQLEMAGPATSMRFLDIVLSYIWQVWFIGEETDTFSVIGAILVSICLMLIGVKKFITVRKARLEYEKLLLEDD